MSAVEYLTVGTVAVLLGLDRVAFLQSMACRPLVAATLTGWLLGIPFQGMQVGILLENEHFALALQADAAGGNVGYAAILEDDAGVGYILLAGEHRSTDGVDSLHRRSNDMLDNINVVDHQVQHHIDICAARFERGDPDRLDEAWSVKDTFQRHQYRIEAF